MKSKTATAIAATAAVLGGVIGLVSINGGSKDVSDAGVAAFDAGQQIDCAATGQVTCLGFCVPPGVTCD